MPEVLGGDSQNTLDVSDIAPRVGQLVGGGHLLEPCTALDIRRWVMGMDYPNPIHWDDEFARNSQFGEIVAPQSMCVALDHGMGVGPSMVGHLPQSHQLIAGDEWWFYGHRLRPGDQLFQERRFHDYRHVETKFAGPSLITRGDTVHRTQHGTPVAKQRLTSIRYLVAESEKRKRHDEASAQLPTWTQDELEAVEKTRHAWIVSGREGVSPRFHEVQVGDRLPRRALGPHTAATFASEWRAFPFNTWGGYRWVGVPGVRDAWVNQDSGYTLPVDYEGARIDPRVIDGLYSGPASGHANKATALEVGMPRAYGYGASMGAWALDYLAYWAGNDGMVRHSNFAYRAPVLEGDVTYIDGEVSSKQAESGWGAQIVSIQLVMVNQDGTVLVKGSADVELPA